MAAGFCVCMTVAGQVTTVSAGAASRYTDDIGIVGDANPGATSAPAAGSVGIVTAYSGGTIIHPYGITSGPDGALWYIDGPVIQPASIGRITTAGVATSFGSGQLATDMSAITLGSDGALWFSRFQSISRIDAAGGITTYTDGFVFNPHDITNGPDGALWFTEQGAIGRLTTSGAFTYFKSPQITQPSGIARGPDDALWFTETGAIGRLATSGVVTLYANPNVQSPLRITAGSDGAMWFTNSTSVGRITTAGAITTFSSSSMIDLDSIAAGPDGALWFTDQGNATTPGSVSRITTSGVVTRYASPKIHVPRGIAAGADGSMWFADNTSNFGPAAIETITTGVVSRTVNVSWTAAEDSRLLQIASYLGETPDAAQKTAVYLLGYLISFLPPNSTPQTLPPPGTTTNYVSSWSPAEQPVIDSVDTKFATTDSESTRLSITLLSFLLGLSGH